MLSIYFFSFSLLVMGYTLIIMLCLVSKKIARTAKCLQLFLTGKERLFLEVARVLRKKVYVTASKLRILKCLGFSAEDMKWFTVNERESHIHVVPLWTLASFKRLKHVSTQYAVSSAI